MVACVWCVNFLFLRASVEVDRYYATQAGQRDANQNDKGISFVHCYFHFSHEGNSMFIQFGW